MNEDQLKTLAGLAVIGAIIGLFRELADPAPVIRWRLAISRSVLTAGLAMGAGAFELVVNTQISPIALCGIAALLATLGTEGIIALLQRLSTRKVEA